MTQELLEGEGETKLVKKTRRRYVCEECGEPATKKHTFLLPNARSNPASKAYGCDDCTWCSDAEVLTCDDCRPTTPEGMSRCATFGEKGFPRMLLYWEEEEVE